MKTLWSLVNNLDKGDSLGVCDEFHFGVQFSHKDLILDVCTFLFLKM